MTGEALKSWIKAFAWAGSSIAVLIAYLSRRDWFVNASNFWTVGFFEGACTMIIVFLFAAKYGDALSEAYSGLRELGRLRKEREAQKENQQ